MRFATIILIILMIPIIVFSQSILYEEYFTGGTPSLNWFSAWYDSVGTPLTPMVATNETGPTDDWIGIVTGDTAILGSLGSALAGDPALDDYSVEADVFIELDSTFYTGLMMRADTTDKVVGYQLVANFYSPFFINQVKFRYFSEIQNEIRDLAVIAAADLPGGAPVVDGWHKMKIKAVGNQFWLYWDGQEIAGSPFIDPDAALDSGYFGAYVWDAFANTPPKNKIDNIVVREAGLYEEYFTSGTPSLNWFSAWYDSVGTPLTPMVATNETGPTDDWIGIVTGDTAILGSLGSALAGDPALDDYSVEADVFIELDSTFYTGLMMRADTTDKVVGYQLVANFYSPFFINQVKFRYFSEIQNEIRDLAVIAAADLPGGAPVVDGWHKMKIKAVGNQFWLYWDGQEIAGSPFIDPDAALDSGYFGAYVWDAFANTPPKIKIDNIFVKEETTITGIFSQDNPSPKNINDFVLFNNYPNPFNPITTIEFELKKAQPVKLTIYDVSGKIIKTLTNEIYTIGRHQVQWNATNESGKLVTSGIYVYFLQTQTGIESKKMILLK